MSLAKALAFTLPAEGGFVDNPHDDGGATNHGITQATYDEYRTEHGTGLESVEHITDGEVADIYQSIYWQPAHCDELSPKLGICHFDWAVNHGVHGAIETLQETLAVTADGVFGPRTRAALETQPEATLIPEYLILRREWYQQRVKDRPDQAEFLHGWLKRVDQLEAFLETL